jgi:drug/metabolite transporter (DMT)-like permease
MLFGEKLSIVKWLSLCIGFLGFIPLLAQQSTGDDFAGAFLFFSWAELAVMLGALSSVYGWILLKQLVHEKGYPPTMANGIGMLLGGIMSLGHSLAVENWTPTPVSETIPFLECTMFLILVSNLICYNLYGYLLKHYSATFMSLAGFTTPFFTALFGWIFLNETVTWPFYVSGVIVFFGLILFYQEELKQAYKVNYATSKIE